MFRENLGNTPRSMARSVSGPTAMLAFAVLAALATMLVAPGVAIADGFIIVQRPVVVAPTQRVEHAPLEVKYHHVTVEIEGQVARTHVDQVFHNPSSQRLEGTYLFPVPKGAKLDKFQMEVNGEMVEAELLAADKARKIYEDIVRRMKDPALLEYVDQDLIKVRIFPIEPHSDKPIKLDYTQVLQRDGNLVDYTYPLNTEKFSSKPIPSVSIKATLMAEHPLKAVYSPSHTVEVTRKGETEAVVGFEASNVTPDTDFRLIHQLAPGEEAVGVSLLTTRPEDGEGFFLLLASPGLAQRQAVQPKDITFVLDTSGSMRNGKLDQAVDALKFCLDNLNDKDRFQIVRFSTEAQPLFDKLQPNNDDTRRQARDFLDQLKPNGGTAIEEALLTAVDPARRPEGDSDRPYMAIFLTDGLPTVGTRDEDQITTAVKKKAGDNAPRVFCFGVGSDVNTHLLDAIADQSRAYSTYVLPDEELELKLSSFYGKIASPVVTDLKVAASRGVTLSKLHPRDLPDLFRNDQLVLTGRYNGDGRARITVEGVLQGERHKLHYPVTFADGPTDKDFIPGLWATRRVGFLLDQIRQHGESPELKDEITRLARAYGIVTPYTSYLIVEEERSREVPVAARTLQDFERDADGREAFAEAEEVYRSLATAKDSDRGVANAQALKRMRRAEQGAAAPGAAMDMAEAEPAVAGGRFAAPSSNRAALDAQANEAALRGVRSRKLQTQNARVVNGRAFFQNGAQWIDATVQSQPEARRVQVPFGSDRYWKLLREHPDAADWMSLGRNVVVLLGDTVYEVTES